jgi:hypothetical protein
MSALWKVETRKMVDTRAGKWLLALTALAAIGGCVAGLVGSDASVADAYLTAGALASVLLPVVGVLLVTSEWSQRTAMLTFVLVPDRNRIALAKVLAAMSVAALLTLLCLIFACVGGPVSGESIDLSLADVGQGLLYQEIVLLIGVALGLALRISPLAIVFYFAAPTVFGIVGAISDTIGDVTRWLDQSGLVALGEVDPSGEDWAKAGVTVLVWIVVPLLYGLFRLRNEDVA